MTAAPFITMQWALRSISRPAIISTATESRMRGPRFHRSLRHYGEVHTVWNVQPRTAAGDARIPHNYAQGPAKVSVNLRISRTWGWGERSSGSGLRNRGDFGGRAAVTTVWAAAVPEAAVKAVAAAVHVAAVADSRAAADERHGRLRRQRIHGQAATTSH